MVRKLIQWAVNSPFVVIVLVLGLVAYGTYAFFNVNVEAYPDPAPAIVEVVAQYPGASAEEVERLVTIPLEVTLPSSPCSRCRARKDKSSVRWPIRMPLPSVVRCCWH